MKLVDRLLFLQAGHCFYCRGPLPREAATVEHLVAVAHEGSEQTTNKVAVCHAVNVALGSITLKEKIALLQLYGGKLPCPQQQADDQASASGPQAGQEERASTQAIINAVLQDIERAGNAKPRGLVGLHALIAVRANCRADAPEVTAVVDAMRRAGKVVHERQGLRYPGLEQES